MSKTVLQIPLDSALRNEAERAALAQGFSSLQESVRLFLRKLADGVVGVKFEEEVKLSAKAVRRYNKILKDIEEGKNIYEAKDVDDLIRQLNA